MTKASPKVSIIIPFFNNPEEALRAATSATRQSYNDIEILLVNDGSSCNIRKIERFVKNPKNRSRLINIDINSGVSVARNTGIRSANGEFLAFLDSDDEFLPDKIKKQLKYMQNSKNYISHTSYIRTSPSGEESVVNSGKQVGNIPKQLIGSCSIAMPTVMLKKDFILKNNLFFNETINYGEDVILWLTIAKNNYIGAIDEALSIVHTSDNSAAFDRNKQILGLKNIQDFLRNDPYYSKYDEEISSFMSVLKDIIHPLIKESGKTTQKITKKYKVLELNEYDLYGKDFNGYSLANYINQTSNPFSAKQIVNHKLSRNKNVVKLFKKNTLNNFNYELSVIEEKILQAKNQLSVSGPALLNHSEYKKADLLHFHMYHNMGLPISLLEKISKDKKIIIDIHDTFWLTDNCACSQCRQARGNKSPINMLEVFDYCSPNAHSLNAQRKRVLANIDATFIVHSPHMLDLFKKSPITKNLDKVQLISLGIELNKYHKKYNQSILRKKYKIPQDNLILFCRAQQAFKGTKYIERALAKTRLKNLTIITVSGKGLLDSLKNNIQIIDLGQVKDENKIIELYNLCDIFLAPSTEESFGIMPVEAMAAGKPVIIFSGTALPDTTFSPICGYQVPSRNSSKLRQAIEHLAENKDERIRRGQLGRKIAFKYYNIENMYQSTLGLYTQIMEAKAHRSPKTTEIVSDPASNDKVDYNSQEISEILDRLNLSLYNLANRYPSKITDTIMKLKRKIYYVANKSH